MYQTLFWVQNVTVNRINKIPALTNGALESGMWHTPQSLVQFSSFQLCLTLCDSVVYT